MINLTIRPMQTNDIPAMMVVNRQCFPTPWSANSIKIDIERNRYSYWMVLETSANDSQSLAYHTQYSYLRRLWYRLSHMPSLSQQHLIGFISFWLINGEAHITNIGVHPAFRRQYLGDLLVWSMLKRAIGLGAQFSSLEVRVSNAPAIRLYHKYQYRIVGQKKGYYRDNNEDAHNMATSWFDEAYQRLLTHRASVLRHHLNWSYEIQEEEPYET